MDSVCFFDETNDWEEGRRDVDKCHRALRRKDLCRDEIEFIIIIIIIIINPFFNWKYQKPSK